VHPTADITSETALINRERYTNVITTEKVVELDSRPGTVLDITDAGIYHHMRRGNYVYSEETFADFQESVSRDWSINSSMRGKIYLFRLWIRLKCGVGVNFESSESSIELLKTASF
jgi:hypothetical protein